MRYALISDIHANLPALEAVLTDIAGRPEVGATYHLGDLVGYAPWPDETVALLERAGIPGVAGNYDSTVATGYTATSRASPSARSVPFLSESTSSPTAGMWPVQS